MEKFGGRMNGRREGNGLEAECTVGQNGTVLQADCTVGQNETVWRQNVR